MLVFLLRCRTMTRDLVEFLAMLSSRATEWAPSHATAPQGQLPPSFAACLYLLFFKTSVDDVGSSSEFCLAWFRTKHRPEPSSDREESSF